MDVLFCSGVNLWFGRTQPHPRLDLSTLHIKRDLSGLSTTSSSKSDEILHKNEDTLRQRDYREESGQSSLDSDLNSFRKRRKSRRERSFMSKMDRRNMVHSQNNSFLRSQRLSVRGDRTKCFSSGSSLKSVQEVIDIDEDDSTTVQNISRERASEGFDSNGQVRLSKCCKDPRKKPETKSVQAIEKKSLWESLTIELTDKLRERTKGNPVGETAKSKDTDDEQTSKRNNILKKHSYVPTSSSIPTESKKKISTKNSSTSVIPPPPPLPQFLLPGSKSSNLRSTTSQTKLSNRLSDSSSSSTIIFRPKQPRTTIQNLDKSMRKLSGENRILQSNTSSDTGQEDHTKTTSKSEENFGNFNNSRTNPFWKSFRELRTKRKDTSFQKAFPYLSLPSLQNGSHKYQDSSRSETSFQYIPSSSSEMSDVETIENTTMKVEGLCPTQFGQLGSVQLCHSNLQEFPTNLLEIKNLEFLDISWNNLSELPSNIYLLRKLQCLNVSHNRLREVNVENLKSLRMLKLSSNIIQHFPVLGQEKGLEVLDLTSNSIWHLPHSNENENDQNGGLGCHGNMGGASSNKHYDVTLKLTQNKLVGGVTFSCFQNVTELDVTDNGITSLEVSALVALTSLKCSNNDIVTISLHGEALLSLTANNNSLTSIRVKSHPRKLRIFDISKNCLGSVPPWLVSCNGLEYCDVSSNNITNLPAYVTSGHLGNLRVLKANFNKLKALSTSEGLTDINLSTFEKRRICSLEILSVHHNQIQFLSTMFHQNFPRLKILNISSNLLNSFPSTYIENNGSRLSTVYSSPLQEVYLSDNRLQDLTPLQGCQNLRIFHAAFNKILTLSENFCIKCELLEELVLSGNDISVLPSTITALKRLKVLRIHLNPIQYLPQLSHLDRLKVIDASYCDLREVNFGGVVGPSLTSLDVAFNPNMAVDKKQFSKCRSERAVSIVDTVSGERQTSLPFTESTYPGDVTSPSDVTVAMETRGLKFPPWKIGFCEDAGKDEAGLKITQLRIPDLKGDGCSGLVGVADGGVSLQTASKLLSAFPKAFQEETLCHTNPNEAQRFALLACLRELAVGKEILPVGFCSAYLSIDDRYRQTLSNNRSSIKRFISKRSYCTLSLCCHGDIQAVVTSVEESPLVVKSNFKHTEEEPHICKNKREELLNLPDPYTKSVRLETHHQSLIIGSRNLWNLIDPLEANNICKNISNPSLAAKRLFTLAQSFGSRESLSILVVSLPSKMPKANSMCTPKLDSSLCRDYLSNQKSSVNFLRDCSSRSSMPNSQRKGFRKVTPDHVDMLGLERRSPIGQSDTEESGLEISKNKTQLFLERIPLNPKQNPNAKKDDNLLSKVQKSFSDLLNDSVQRAAIIKTKHNYPFGPNADNGESYINTISPPAGFGDTDTDSGPSSDSDTSKNNDKIFHQISDKKMNMSSSVSEVSEEQFKSWEYLVAKNTKILHLQEFGSGKLRPSAEGCSSSSVPDLATHSDSSEHLNFTEEEEENSKTLVTVTSQNPLGLTGLNGGRHLENKRFQRNNFLRNSRLARGASKLLQNTINIGTTLKGDGLTTTRTKSTNFKRFGSLQNLKYYQTNRPWLTNNSSSQQKISWVEPKTLSEEMMEKSVGECVEMESRMKHYWNSGITAF